MCGCVCSFDNDNFRLKSDFFSIFRKKSNFLAFYLRSFHSDRLEDKAQQIGFWNSILIPCEKHKQFRKEKELLKNSFIVVLFESGPPSNCE